MNTAQKFSVLFCVTCMAIAAILHTFAWLAGNGSGSTVVSALNGLTFSALWGIEKFTKNSASPS